MDLRPPQEAPMAAQTALISSSICIMVPPASGSLEHNVLKTSLAGVMG